MSWSAVSRAVGALQTLRLKPNAPVQPQDITVESIRELWAESVNVELDAVPIRMASIAHLIRLKEISNRPRDVADIALLRELLGPP